MPRHNGVLVVEDDVEIREVMCDLLRDEGYRVSSASDGEEALSLLGSLDVLPCLILLDISMPGMDGYAFREVQRRDPRLLGIPTAMISADGRVQEKAARVGVVEYLRKPLELDQLIQLVAKHCDPM